MKFGQAKHWTKDTVLFKTGQATASFFILAICFPPGHPSNPERTALGWVAASLAQRSERRISLAEVLHSSTSPRARMDHLIISLLLGRSKRPPSTPGYWHSRSQAEDSD